ncbi:MAG: NAD-dependent epimerase/dehydratase family protein [Gammaproteobacteria bacterium]|jgi:UDP-glucose 4-epimerase|nr:NAD-dependent epimerase/dehydratase family protein [Gammaproteobacteria bacterium]MBT3723860.1 NAD-dependent epimerase/dehydratase family protein [Gammaproteobacteria bacterium]MBT4076002.1 NAD-dependent epimerase/dehydratase family protein [Gammaproteobacteria bacterium]MBT4452350.1 NAD-dependent epimerase/dehydratase family protein [Gammaproteobacteria bacterium]MBT4861985.1 NAD-dependent epimerase/dehydratase family protein [Gammaproteobacteria bacterium]
MKKVLITGGAGFIGSHTADLLMQNGIAVRVLDNLSSGFRSNLPANHELLEFVEGDIRNKDIVNQCMHGVTHCLHLAAQVSVVASLEDPEFSAQQNIVGFVNVIEAVKNHGVKRLVYASSAAIYGTPKVIPLPEDVEKTQLSPYGVEKQVNEQYAELYKTLYKTSSLGQRFFNVFGPRQDPKSPYAGVIALFVDRISEAMPLTIFGDGEQTRDFIYVGDVARANVAALQHVEVEGACNIGTGLKTSLLDLVNVLSEITGQNSEITFDEPREGDIVHSLAITKKMNEELEITAQTDLKQGLEKLISSGS